MVVGGEVVNLKSLEEAAGLLIAEMPINVSGNFESGKDQISMSNL